MAGRMGWIGALAGAAVALGALTGVAAAQETTLQKVKARGELNCGTSQGIPGFSLPNDKGVWEGFDTDYCRAISAAIFDDPDKTKFLPLTSKDRFTILATSQIDLLVRTTTWTMSRDASLGVIAAGVNYYDGQGFLARKGAAKSIKDMNGATICVPQGTTSELNVSDFARSNGLKFETVAFAELDPIIQALEGGRCDAYSTDASQLYTSRFKLSKPDDYVVLPDIISKEPLGAWVKRGDEQWFMIVRWTLMAMLGAEELGVTQANVDEMLKSTNPDVRRLLGVDGVFGEQLGLTKDWAYRIIKKVGNYGESFERHLGKGSKMQMERGLNALWNKGGLQYPAPVR
jgi:general L-amino acid transport system substrate-binding protein